MAVMMMAMAAMAKVVVVSLFSRSSLSVAPVGQPDNSSFLQGENGGDDDDDDDEDDEDFNDGDDANNDDDDGNDVDCNYGIEDDCDNGNGDSDCTIPLSKTWPSSWLPDWATGGGTPGTFPTLR